MRRYRLPCAVVSATLLIHAHVGAQQLTKIPVVVKHTGSDTVGMAFMWGLHDRIRNSKGMRLIQDDQSIRRIVVRVVTADYDDRQPGRNSVIGVSFIYAAPDIPAWGAFLSSGVQTCSVNRIVQCSEPTVRNLDQVLQNLQSNWPEGHETLTEPAAAASTARGN